MSDDFEKLVASLQNNPNIESTLAPDGFCGTYFLKNEEKYVAVFKDSQQDQLSPGNKRGKAQAMRFGRQCINTSLFFTAIDHCVTGQSFASDYVSYQLAEAIGFEHAIIPEAIIADGINIENEPKKGAVIKWIPKAKSLKDYTNSFKRLTEKPDKIPFEAFDEMAAFDYITGNLDRNLGNLLLSEEDNYLYLIDNSWAFSPLQGEELSMNQYAWGNQYFLTGFPLLEERHFSAKSKEKIAAIYNNRYEHARMVFNSYCRQKPPGETIDLSYQRAMCFLHRVEMLHFLVNKKDFTFGQLCQIRFEEDFLHINKIYKYIEKKPLLSSHFIDSKEEVLTEDGIQNKTDHPDLKRTAAEKRYSVLFAPLSGNESLLEKALLREIARLNAKQADRDWCALWRDNYKIKAEKVNNAFEDLKQSVSEDHPIDELISSAMNNPESSLYQGLNQHTSFIFKFTLDWLNLSTETQAICNLKEEIRLIKAC